MNSFPDVTIVQKQTAIERYTRRPLNVDFFEYLERDGQNLTCLVEAHKDHVETRTALLEELERLGLSYEIFNLDELLQSPYNYYREFVALSGFNPTRKLVISLGGDGTLLHASHYTGGEVCLLGVNSCPRHSVGHLCALQKETLEDGLKRFLEDAFPSRQVRRLRIQTSQGHDLPLGLNDVLLCNRHPAATSRYQVSIAHHNHALEEALESERQQSSGIWIAGPAGATAAIRAYGLPQLELSSHEFLCAVREPYSGPGYEPTILRRVLDGNKQEFRFFSRMRQGLVCVDGPDSSASLGFGESVVISLPPEGSLKLLLQEP